jgi:pyruvate dehydrogenase E2 component (dihydrolipoamide acetyltransferase)
MFGITEFSAIINPPQACIIAVGAGVEKPLVKNGQIEIGTTMMATLSCDHRVVDGAVGAQFLQAFQKYIQNPVLLFV